jgi:hypothetical protein
MLRRPLTFLDKSLFCAACGVGVALCMTVGWMAVEPADPLGAVSLVAQPAGALVWIQVVALTAVTAALANILAGRRFSNAGLLVAAIGVTAMSLRGGNARQILVQAADGLAPWASGLGVKLFAEALAWWLLLVIAAAVEALVARWFGGDFETSDAVGDDPGSRGKTPRASAGTSPAVANLTAAHDVPVVGRVLFGVSPDRQTIPKRGLLHAGVLAVAAFLVSQTLSAGLTERAVYHGQACFLAGASMGIAVLLVQRWVPVRSALWGLLAFPGFLLLGYAWTMIRSSGAEDQPLVAPASAFLRMLPIQAAGAGIGAMVLGYWFSAGSPQQHASAGTNTTR